jgi:hypothetical protein
VSPLRATALVAILGLAVLALPAAGGAHRGGAEFRGCKSVGDGNGNRELVEASEIGCQRARKLAKKFIREDKLRDGWKATNPAGCEWLMFKKRDAEEFDGPVPQPVPGAPLIFFTKTAGCVS